MKPKLAAAIITGTMASPSSPSVRFTALPAPTMTKAPNGTKNQPRLRTRSLKKGKVSDVDSGGSPTSAMTDAGDAPRSPNSSASRARPEKPLSVCLVTLR